MFWTRSQCSRNDSVCTVRSSVLANKPISDSLLNSETQAGCYHLKRTHFESSSFGLDRSVLSFTTINNSSSVWHRSLVSKWYSFTHSFNWALFRKENLRVSGKQRRIQRNFKSTCCPLHCRSWRSSRTFLWITTRRLWGNICFDVHLLETSEGLGWGEGNGYEISMGQERVILEGINIFWKFYTSLEVVPIIKDLGLTSHKQMDIVARSGLKWVHFPLKYNTMVWPLCIFDLHHLTWGWNSLPSRFFSPCFHKYQPISSKFSVFNLLWKCSDKNEKGCGKLLTHFSLYLYRIFSSYFFVSDIFSFNWVKRKTSCWSSFFIKTLKFSKFQADVSIAQETQDSNTFSGIFQPRI